MKIAYLIGLAIAVLPAIPSYTEYVAEPEPPPYSVVVAEVSAYTSSPDETWGDPFITASGARTGHGVLACPSKYEFGTKVEIAGKTYTCLDRMNARYREREVFDVWMSAKPLAYEWGRQKLQVKIFD